MRAAHLDANAGPAVTEKASGTRFDFGSYACGVIALARAQKPLADQVLLYPLRRPGKPRRGHFIFDRSLDRLIICRPG